MSLPNPTEQLYLELREVARLMGWSKRKTFRWLRREGAMLWRGGRWVTTPELLQRSFPEVLDRMMFEALDAQGDG